MKLRPTLPLAALICTTPLASCQDKAAIAAKPFESVATKGEFAAGDELSGIASLDGRLCMVVSNETRSVQLGTLDVAGKTFTAGDSATLEGPGEDEMDFEAVAADATTRYFYVMGSHSVSKKKAKPRPEQSVIYRISEKDALAGAAQISANARLASLTKLIRSVPELSSSIGGALQKNGLCLEGLAARDGKLFIGFRSPNVDGKSPILEIPAEAVFGSDATPPKLHWVSVGEKSGIRDMSPATDGFLLLCGDAGANPTKDFPQSQNWQNDTTFTIHHWNPATGSVEKLGQIAPGARGGAEGLLVAKESAESITVMMLFDGSRNGGPVLQTYKRKPSAAK